MPYLERSSRAKYRPLCHLILRDTLFRFESQARQLYLLRSPEDL
jgi:hypothetical protein